MANVLQTGMEVLAAIQQSHAGRAITYRRAGKSPLPITVTDGAAGRQIDTSSGELTWHDKDWLILASDISALGEPERGDVIAVDGKEYTILPPEGEPIWRPADNHGVRYRVHTKRTK